MLNVFKKKWVIFSLIGVVALSLLIWFLGPFLIESLGDSLNRWLTILPLWLVWLGIILWLYLRERKNSQAMADNIAKNADVSAADAEIASLKERFEDALYMLRQGSKKRYGDQYLYELPWYIIIGPPGSGKTTILKNSELRFPLDDEFGPEIRGVGGTRDCDWFFTDDAILLDTAGRYLTQDSYEAVDKQTWQGFLKLLKESRKRRPVNGILIVLSIEDFMIQNGSEQHIRAIRARLNELDRVLKIRFPIYVLFTKCDLMAGFVEFFEHLDKKARGQVWGMTFQEDAIDKNQGAIELFADEFDQLMAKLNATVLQRVHDKINPDNRALVYNFPPQISSLKATLNDFLQSIFRPNRFQPAPFLRGVYFTSGTQAGAPIDRLMAHMAGNFGLEQRVLSAHSGDGRSYFVNQLFKDVIFPESDIVGLDLRHEKRRLWLQRAAIASAVLITICLGWLWWQSYDSNKTYVENLAQHADDYCVEKADSCKSKSEKLTQADFKAILPALDSLQQAAQIYPTLRRNNEGNVPVSMRFGLYQGDQLNTSAYDAYSRVLNRVFLRHIALYLYNQLAEQLTGGVADDKEGFLYQTLKVYLMLTAEYVNKLEPALLEEWLTREWAESPNINTTEQARLQGHLQALLQTDLIPIQQTELEDTVLVERVRNVLLSEDRSLQLYWQIKEAANETQMPNFRVKTELREPVTRVFVSTRGDVLSLEIPGLFTYDSYCDFFRTEVKRVVKDSMTENWVLGIKPKTRLKLQPQLDKTGAKKLTRQVEELYFDEYIKHWKELVYSFKIIPLPDVDTAVRMLNTASIPRSPMRLLLQKLEKNTILICESASQKSKKPGIVERTLTNKAGTLGNYYKQAKKANRKGKPEAEVSLVVADEFEPLFKLVQGEKYHDEPIYPVLEQFGKVRDLLNTEEAVRTKRNDAIGNLQLMTMDLPSPVRDWLKYIITHSKRFVNTAAAHQEAEAERELARLEAEAAAKAAAEAAEKREQERIDAINNLDHQWRSVVLAEYHKLQDFYPLSPNGEDMPLSSFARFFGPGGTLAQFFDQHLAAYIDKAGWRFNDNPLGLSRGVLGLFKQAEQIQDAFFQVGSELSVNFYLKPKELSGNNVNQFRLLLGEQEFYYAYGPIRERKLKWPANGANVQFILAGGRHRAPLQQAGEWAWFRILDDVNSSGSQLTVTSGDAVMQCQIRVDSVENPFRLVRTRVLSSFWLPERLN